MEPSDLDIKNEIIKLTEEYKRRRKVQSELDEFSKNENEDNCNGELIVEFIGNFEKFNQNPKNGNEVKKKKKNKKKAKENAKIGENLNESKESDNFINKLEKNVLNSDCKFANETNNEDKNFRRKIELTYEINPHLSLSYDIKEISK